MDTNGHGHEVTRWRVHAHAPVMSPDDTGVALETARRTVVKGGRTSKPVAAVRRKQILIATGTPALGAGLATWISGQDPSWKVAAIVTDRRTLRSRLTPPPALVVAGLCLEGVLVTADLDAFGAQCPLLVLVDGLDVGQEAELLRAGAAGVLPSSVDRTRFVRTVGELIEGRAVASVAALRSLAAGPPDRPELTGRQRQILELMAQGCTTDEIARRLVVRPTTVKTHISRLALRLGVPGRHALAQQAAALLADMRVVGETTPGSSGPPAG